jgi:hypothetical protein
MVSDPQGHRGLSISLGRPGSFAERLRVVAASLALGIVSWQALESIVDVASELGKPAEQHLRVLRSSPEELVRRKLGTDFELLLALRSHVPREAEVKVSYDDVRSGYPELRRRTTWLQSLVYPMVLDGWPVEPGRKDAPPGKADRQEFVIDLGSSRDYSAWPLCRELAKGPKFRLLQVGTRAQ